MLIRNTQEDKLFKVNVDLANWTEDALYALAGRHTGLAELVSDHYAKLHGALDQELQNTVTAEVEDKLDTMRTRNRGKPSCPTLALTAAAISGPFIGAAGMQSRGYTHKVVATSPAFERPNITHT